MIPQELIDRLRKCCEWLGKEMPEKYNSIHALLIFKFKDSEFRLIDFFQENPIRPDPLCEYPNALHRIVKEATGKELSVTHFYYNKELRRHLYDFAFEKFYSCAKPGEYIELNSKFPLHAEIEATCIAIEGMIK